MIKAIAESGNPRILRVVARPAPTEREKSQKQVQRYLPHLCSDGKTAIFNHGGTIAESGDGL